MGEKLFSLFPSASDRGIGQAIIALKKGAHVLKYRARGTPNFCPFGLSKAIVALKNGAHLLKYGKRWKPKIYHFRLSMDEKFLVWYFGEKERQLLISSITNVVGGQPSKQLHPDRKSQCLSIVYANGERSLDLMFKDKEEADMWFLGLRVVTSRAYISKEQRVIQSCINSPADFMRRKDILGLLKEKIRPSQVLDDFIFVS